MDLIVKEQFINACSEELAVYLLEREPMDLVELSTWAQQYLIAHKQQLGGKTKSTLRIELVVYTYLLDRGPKDLVELIHATKSTVQLKRVEQRKPTQSKLDVTQKWQRSLQCYRCQGYGHRHGQVMAIRMSDQCQSRQGSEEFDACWPE